MEAESGICDGREHLLTRGRNTLVQKDLHCGLEAQNSTAYFMYSLSRDSNEDGSGHETNFLSQIVRHK